MSHELTHTPYADWCPTCVSAMGKDMPLPVNRALKNLSDRSIGLEGDSDGDLTPMTPAIFRLVLPISVALLFLGPGAASLSLV